jgi:ribonuclease HII
LNLKSFSVEQIRDLVMSVEPTEIEFLQAMAEDPRMGVQKLYQRLLRKRRQQQEEAGRMALLFLQEDDLRARGYRVIAGVDEAGRGPLAGPVVAAAVVFGKQVDLPGLNDSKKLTSSRREALAWQIKKQSLAWAVGVSTVSEILRLNIHQASLVAMRRAVLGLEVSPEHVLADGFAIPGLEAAQTSLVGGDGRSAVIAAASIIAKTTRDRLMEVCHHLYPRYGFDRHKGYGTAGHLQALEQYGPCPLHRMGFVPVQNSLKQYTE